MNLHCSQTYCSMLWKAVRFYTSMNLHCSQTKLPTHSTYYIVLYLYEFTLLSNPSCTYAINPTVLYLYEFTLLSNSISRFVRQFSVLYLYEFTLLSNIQNREYGWNDVLYLYEFTLLSNMYRLTMGRWWFYTSMNLHCSQTKASVYSLM